MLVPWQIWDMRHPRPTLSLAAHQFEILSADWCKYNDCIIATGSVDKSIKVRNDRYSKLKGSFGVWRVLWPSSQWWHAPAADGNLEVCCRLALVQLVHRASLDVPG